MNERKILILDGDTQEPHPNGVCSKALALRDKILLEEDRSFGRTPFGRVSRTSLGCLVEIIPREK